MNNEILGKIKEVDSDDGFFNSSVGLKLSAEAVVEELIGFMKNDPKRHYKILVGTDSDGHNGNGVDFVTAVVIHRVGNGARYFWRRIELGKFHTLRDRIIQEVVLSLDVARNILSLLREFEAPQFDFEIHADIGENGDSRTVIQEVAGMIRAYNFEFRTKPESYAATNAADRHT